MKESPEFNFEEEQRVVCSILAKKVKEYYRDPEHQRQFEEWYQQKYGKPYEGKRADS
ncbi:MAG: hypothetical protein LUD78_04685 [Clostridiales bacterium]|nr:hypothetical protein [Clostridiales bacterium]